MGHGKPVVGYIMEVLIANPDLRLQLGRKSIEFVNKIFRPN
jgi:hypothetical protein